jgi:hypothetical protein
METCPVYPYNCEDDHICKYLTEDGYENYRCPQTGTATDMFWPVFERGTREDKKALEHLADMYVRYSLMKNPPAECRNDCLAEAVVIYHNLGLKKKEKDILKKFPCLK